MRRFKFLFVLIGVGLCFTPSAIADRIVLKDGTVEESERVWESKEYVHFILLGTQTVEIRYAKALVDRIERKNQPPEQPTLGPEPGKSAKPAADAPLAAPAVRLTEADRRRIEGLKGIAFYDPRRPKRYWASADSQHATLEGAIDVLARQYGRSPEWVLAHVGEENDLALIHEKLHLGDQAPDGASSTEKGPRSPQPGPSAAPEAMSAKVAGARPAIPAGEASGGVQFYDPRRTEKYWVSPEEHFRTLSEAVAALAGIYHMSAEWVETHMGDSNELTEIHQNLKNALAKSDTEKK